MIDFYALVSRKRQTQFRTFFVGFTQQRNSIYLYINKIVWNERGDTIRLIGKFIGQQGFGDLYLECFRKTSTWRHSYFLFLDYKQLFEDTTTNPEIFGELTNSMSIYTEY